MADKYIGYGYYEDDKGVYQLINGKKSYLDKNLNTDDSKLITTRGGTPIYEDTNGKTITYKNGVKTDLGTGEPIKTTNEKQLSIGDLKQQAYAEKNKELQQRLTEVKSSEEYKNIKAKAIANAMANFKVTLDNLKNKFCNNRAVYTMYFKMTLNNNNTVLIDTTSNDWDENCLISFKYELNGSGEANKFTLDLLYKPNDRSFSSIKTLESKLLSNVGICTDENGKQLKSMDVLYNNCSFAYGYADDLSLRSPTYNGMILDYDCKIENGNLRYTITGVGGLTSMKETRISAKDEYLVDKDGKEINTPLGYIQNIIRIELAEKGLYNLQILDNIDPEKVVTIGEDYKQFNQKNIFQVIGDILSQCITEDQKNVLTGDDSSEQKRILPTQKQLYGYYVSDIPTTIDGKNYKGTIYIYEIPAANGPENKENAESPKADLGITFNWFGPGEDSGNTYTGIVKEWNPKYDGSVLFGMAANLLSHNDSTSYYTMDAEGNIIQVQGLGAAREGTLTGTNDGIASTIQEYSNWAFLTQYPYSATMTIIGCPCEVPMIGKIMINALMGSEKHHSSGVYFVLKKTDTINNSGFWSEFELFKIVVTYDPDYSVIKKDESKIDDPVSDDNGNKQQEQSVTESDMINAGLGPRNPDNYIKDENGNIVEKNKTDNILDINIWDSKFSNYDRDATEK